MRLGIVAGLAALALGGCDRPDPGAGQARLHLPPPGFAADAGAGARLFAEYCARCHGRAARGTDRGPPLVHRTYRSSHHGDLAFHLAVKNGVRQHHWRFGDMPPVPGLDPKQVAHIVAFVRREQRRAGIR